MNQTVKFGKARLARHYADKVSTWEMNSKWSLADKRGRWATRRSGVAKVKNSQ